MLKQTVDTSLFLQFIARLGDSISSVWRWQPGRRRRPRAANVSKPHAPRFPSDRGSGERRWCHGRARRRSRRVVLKTIRADHLRPSMESGDCVTWGFRAGRRARFHDLRWAALRRPMCGSSGGVPRRTNAPGRGRGFANDRRKMDGARADQDAWRRRRAPAAAGNCAGGSTYFSAITATP
jgi:hypothetical protein